MSDSESSSSEDDFLQRAARLSRFAEEEEDDSEDDEEQQMVPEKLAAKPPTKPKEKRKEAQRKKLAEAEDDDDDDEDDESVLGDEDADDIEQIETFQDLIGKSCSNGQKVSEELVKVVLEGLGKDAVPTEVQQQAWGAMLSERTFHRNVIAISKTGSGKTLAFLIPILTELQVSNGRNDPNDPLVTPEALIIAPTRELAKQSFDVAERLVTGCPSLKFAVGCALGGQAYGKQVEILLNLKPRLLVATPGRLCDLCAKGEEVCVRLDCVQSLVLDEADRMLDLGFSEDLTNLSVLLKKGGNRPRLVLTSATWQEEIESRLGCFFPTGEDSMPPVFISVGSAGKTVSKSVTQIVEYVPQRGSPRFRKLTALLQSIFKANPESLVIVFTMYKGEAKDVANELLTGPGIIAVALQGDMSQTARHEAVAQFRKREARVLVATDVAARGLDIAGVTQVINYSLGISIENYIHRCGRTGRAGAFGTAHTFVTKGDEKLTPELVELLQEAKQNVPDDIRILANKERKRRAAREGSGSGSVGPSGQITKAAPALTEDELLRQENKERQLKIHQAKMAKQHAGMKPSKRGGRGRRR